MGEVFAGRFELLAPVAVGGNGSVWVVRDARDARTYAGKVMRHSDSATLLRFLREQATRISHPNVLTPLAWAGEDDRVLFTMPLVRGGSVATLVGDHGALPPSWAGALVDQALQALVAVHATGVVHRDVKPANLLLDATGRGTPRVWLADFGIAARVGDPRLTSASQVVGTPGYMAPEQRRGEDPDPRQDLYAVGVLGLEVLTAVAPPAARAEALDLHRDGEGRALVHLLVRACDPDPERRPESAAALLSELRALALPPPGPDDGIEVFEHVPGVAPDATVVRPREPAPAPAPAPPSPPSSSALRMAPAPAPSRAPARSLGVALLVLAVVCLVGAAVVLVG